MQGGTKTHTSYEPGSTLGKVLDQNLPPPVEYEAVEGGVTVAFAYCRAKLDQAPTAASM